MHLHEPPAAASESSDLTRELWETAPSGAALLELLGQPDAYARAGLGTLDRQLRLFAAWCARRTGSLLPDPRSREAVRAAELFASGSASSGQVEGARADAEAAVREIAALYGGGEPHAPGPDSDEAAGVARETALGCALLHAAYTACHAAAHTLGRTGGLRAAEKCAETARRAIYWRMVADGACADLVAEKLDEEDRRQAEALRTFIGNPFDAASMPPLALALAPRAAAAAAMSASGGTS